MCNKSDIKGETLSMETETDCDGLRSLTNIVIPSMNDLNRDSD